ncbi:MAG TPA: xanthine dehydrogenase family protein molybdopterin-binding subunit, partial [Xanthobacteraceae bacterium]
MSINLPVQSYGIGQAVRRVEDARFLTGRGRFVDDIELPHQCHAVVVLSAHAHARIRRIDASTARAAAGVVCVLTGEDVGADGLGSLLPNFMPEDIGGPTGLRTRRPILVRDKVRCVGDRVAMVVAETLA